MSRVRALLPRLAVLAGVLLFLVGIGRLFSLRFAGGDVFPSGSSRRADPRGTRAFHDALSRIPGRRVTRNLERLGRLPEPGATTLFLFGLQPSDIRPGMDGLEWREVAQFAAAGGRVVAGLSAEEAWTASLRSGAAGATNGLPGFDVQQAWQFSRDTERAPARVATRVAPGPGLPEAIAWPSSGAFRPDVPPWEVVYTTTNGPVVMRRAIGPGEVILLASDFAVSNEALRDVRETGLLAWLAGDRPRIVFDETHLGLALEPGLASLVRRYRLGGGIAGVLLLAGLYVWRSVLPLHVVPPDRSPPAGGAIAGRPAEDGMLHLIERSLPPHELADACLRAWEREPGPMHHVSPDTLDRVREIVAAQGALRPRDRDPVGTYREISRLLHPPRTPWKST